MIRLILLPDCSYMPVRAYPNLLINYSTPFDAALPDEIYVQQYAQELYLSLHLVMTNLTCYVCFPP